MTFEEVTEQNASAEIKSWWRGDFVIDKHTKEHKRKRERNE